MPGYILYVSLVFHLLILVRAQERCGNITLPWGLWQGELLPSDSNICLFRNVRFGSQPMRFGPPSFPTNIDPSPQNSSYGFSCIQINSSELEHPPGGRNGLLQPHIPTDSQSEDCLFLDIYAPVAALALDAKKLPVIVWFYGGAFAFGSKDSNPNLPLYSGQAVLQATGYSTVFVTGNYRLGAFGWLAGSYMQNEGLPNAGLYDQSLLLEWTQTYIGQAGGDNTTVSAWGESAGASSILHHLIRENGTRDPLFKAFLAQSPAYQWSWDNSPNGRLDTVFQEFSQLANCGSVYNMTCLQDASVQTLIQANQALYNSTGESKIFPLGPSVDGAWIQTLPAVALNNNARWPGINASLISHVANESFTFTPTWVIDQTTFDQYLDSFMPEDSLQPEKTAIRNQYNCTQNFNGNFTNCIGTVIRDSSFTCNTRQLFNAYPKDAYMMQYAYPKPEIALHATDLLPAFMNNESDAFNMIESVDPKLPPCKAWELAETLLVIKKSYQNYLGSFGQYWDPSKIPGTRPTWLPAVGGEELSNVMDVRLRGILPPFKLVDNDDQNKASTCNFWTGIAQQIEAKTKGYGARDLPKKHALTETGKLEL